MPANSAPTSVPQSALETVMPRAAGDSPNSARKSAVTPAITAVSKPNISPARAAETTLPSRIPPLIGISLALAPSALSVDQRRRNETMGGGKCQIERNIQPQLFRLLSQALSCGGAGTGTGRDCFALSQRKVAGLPKFRAKTHDKECSVIPS